ncbi:MAG: ATP-dependent DNA helicase RecG, partial [Alphaproteobacteria bacterium]
RGTAERVRTPESPPAIARDDLSGRELRSPAAPPTPGIEAWLDIARRETTVVPGVGPARAAELERFGIRSVEDLLYHVPFRYEDRRQVRRVRDLHPGESATVELEIRKVDERRAGPGGKRTVLSATATDETGVVELVWFNQVRWFRSRLKPGGRWFVHGRVERGYQSAVRITHPEMESADERDDGERSNRIVPVYEKPTAMPAAAMRRTVHAAVDGFAGRVADAIPAALRARHRLLSLGEALRRVHRPGPEAEVSDLGAFRSEAHRSIVFDEFFFVQLDLLRRKAQLARETGIVIAPAGDMVRRMVESLPFPLTGAQRRVIEEIAGDQAKPHPMHRLLQGDVGSGKTVVAVAASLRAIESGWQAVVMAPTELLAEQHWETIRRVAGGLGVPLWYLSGEVAAAERRAILPRLEAGEPGLVVGTHALIQEGVRFGRLGLAVIDEQHRFGVMQRASLSRTAGETGAPDVLLMSATPIPRTLALSAYGDLDLSYLDELPPGRKPVSTTVHSVGQRRRVYDLVRREIGQGRQAFVVYPLIEESEGSDLRDATSAAEELRSEIFPDLRVALVHGRMSAQERDVVMRAFKDRRFDVLVATTVIEVGIDVPNASVIVIEHAERFGLAQLHQLRGRVGRGSDEAFCLLVADWAQSKEARERLAVMTETRDGLRIAEADLAIRGPGTLLGTRQAGLPDFRVANLLRDADVLGEARAAAQSLLDADPWLRSPEAQGVLRVLEARRAGRLALSRVG